MKHGTKAAAIREYLTANPDAKAKAVVDALASQRIKVTPTQVYGIKSTGPTDARTKTGRPKPKLNGYEPLVQAKRMADSLGGVDKARAALDVLARILG